MTHHLNSGQVAEKREKKTQLPDAIDDSSAHLTRQPTFKPGENLAGRSVSSFVSIEKPARASLPDVATDVKQPGARRKTCWTSCVELSVDRKNLPEHHAWIINIAVKDTTQTTAPEKSSHQTHKADRRI